MRVLQVHNFYRTSAPSGEDEVVRAERQLLTDHGIEVIPFERHNDDLPAGLTGAVSAAASNVWSRASRRELANLIERQRPDVAHFHNTFPQISVSAYAACRSRQVPIVQTLHNFRMFCANGLMLRAGAPCDDCLGGLPWPALRHACYRDSRLATAGMAFSIAVHRLLHTPLKHVSRFVVLTEFAARVFEAAGIPRARMVLRGNTLAADPGVGDGAGGYVLFVGRLTREKGVATLIEAWKQRPATRLLIVGDGELRAACEAAALGLPIEFMGRLPVEEVLRLMRAAALLVIPSECFEGFPRVFGEALATGTPVVASRIGGLAELLADGSVGTSFSPGDPHDLARTIGALLAEPHRLAGLRRAAREIYQSRYSLTSACNSLLEIYHTVTSSPDPTAPSALPVPTTLPRPPSPLLRQ